MSHAFTRCSRFIRLLLASYLLVALVTAPATAQTVYGLATANNVVGANLVTFSVTAPATYIATIAITGLTSGQTLVGLDARPNTGELFALGYNPTGTQAQLYTLNPTTGALTAVGTALTLNLGTTINRIGFDFNPTVDRIRVTSGARTNFRLNPSTGALAATDGTLTYATGDINASQTPGIGSSAYTNSYIGSTATTLYNIDEPNSRLVSQVPPNDGTLNTIGAGALGVGTNAALYTDLDISFNTATSTNVAYMTAVFSGVAGISSTLYTVDLGSGVATSLGGLGTTGSPVTDIALPISRPTTLPTITGQLAYALAGTNLLTFDTALPGTIRTSVGITGVDASQTLVGMDVRPLNNALYALGYNAAAATGVNNSQLYTLNATTGVATPQGAAFRLELGTGNVGFDFNPTVDRIRVVSASTRNNYRLNPVFGAASVLAATDGQVAYATVSIAPLIGAVAYTNSFNGSTATTLYNYDQGQNLLNTQATANPPADGQLTPVGNSGITVNSAAPVLDLDIFSTTSGVNTAYLVANPNAAAGTTTAANTLFYTVNLTTGAATLVGNGLIGNGISVRNIAVAVATGVVTGTRAAELATDLTLYPNPATNGLSLSFGLPRAAHVELLVTDLLGRPVATLDAGQLPAGPQTLRWARGSQAAGLYLFRLRFDGQPAATRQVTLE